MKRFTSVGIALLCVLALAQTAKAAPLTLQLQRTSVLFNEDPPGAPLPLSRKQYDAGNVLINGQKIGEYLSVKDVNAGTGTLNVAALTITLFVPNGTSVPSVIRLEGVHEFTGGGQRGSIAASDISGLVGIGFTGSTATGTITLLFP